MDRLTEQDLVQKVKAQDINKARLGTSQVIRIVLNILSEEYAKRPYGVIELLKSRPGFKEVNDGT